MRSNEGSEVVGRYLVVGTAVAAAAEVLTSLGMGKTCSGMTLSQKS